MLASALVMLALLGGITFYFARRMTQCVQYLFPTFPFIVPLAVFTLLTFALVGGFVRSVVPLSAFVKEALRVVSAYWMGAFVYLLVYLVLADIVVLAGRILHLIPRPLTSAVRFASVAAALALTAATCVYGFCHAAYAFRIGDIGLHGHGTHTLMGELFHKGVGLRFILIVMDDDIRTGIGQTAGHHAAQLTGTAGDKRGLPAKIDGNHSYPQRNG